MRLLSCLTDKKNFGSKFDEAMRARGIDMDGIRECLDRMCKKEP
ncbi:hypothetical protein [Amycolatopsis sp. NPDC051102]